MNALVKQIENTSLITSYGDRDPYEAMADEVAPRSWIGGLLKFKQGTYVVDKTDDVPLGTVMLAIPKLNLHGWVHWRDGKPIEKIYARTFLGERPPMRHQLDDKDEDTWPIGLSDKPEDPWKETMMLPVLAKDGAFAATFVTDSYGGRKAVGDMARIYTSQRYSKPDQMPLISLQCRIRKNQFGTKDPHFPVIGWEPQEKYRAALKATGILELLEELPADPLQAIQKEVAALPPRPDITPNLRSRQAEPEPEPAAKPDFDDEIPW